MAAAKTPLAIIGAGERKGAGSNELVLKEASNELFFAVVGHAGSGTSVVANALKDLLQEMLVGGNRVEVEILKAREVIQAWAEAKGRPLPTTGGPKRLDDVKLLQDYGDEMRAEIRKGQQDHAAVARRLVSKIREVRARKLGIELNGSSAVRPDGKPRAYILDALRHPAEVRLLRHLYNDAFVLIGVFCEEQPRAERMIGKYGGAREQEVRRFMARDADAKEKHGQHVADAFHLADYFVDNTADRIREAKRWDVPDKLSRLVKIIAHSEIVRPFSEETAMYHAYSAQMQSACLSRQVGAALVDMGGNMLATGTNEVPRAGGGVYGESFDALASDSRCAMFPNVRDRFCRNTQKQNEIIKELIEEVPELSALSSERKGTLAIELRRTRIGSLLEFSRAVHAEMDALLSAARKGISLVGTRLFVTAFPCHFCARHIVSAGVDEVQYIEPYPKSQALELHRDAITTEPIDEWKPPSQGGTKVLFRPFSGVSPRLYERAFLKERELKDKITGIMEIQEPSWGVPWHLSRASYPELEAKLLEEV
jgi:deoxycytidylate deaminase/dephospho-CoA kinase